MGILCDKYRKQVLKFKAVRGVFLGVSIAGGFHLIYPITLSFRCWGGLNPIAVRLSRQMVFSPTVGAECFRPNHRSRPWE